MQTQSNGMRAEAWTDLATGRHRSVVTLDGKPFSESVTATVDGKVQLDSVHYQSRVWVTFTPGVPGPHGQTPDQLAQTYRDLIARGMYKNLGQDDVGGRPTYHLRRSSTFDTPVGKHSVTTDLWVDALTYLPVKQRGSTGGQPSSSETSYDWLPRTAANLAKLDLVVPDGFRHEQQSAAGCSSSSGSSGSWLVFSLGGTTTTSCSHVIVAGHS